MPKKSGKPGRKGVPQKKMYHQADMILNSGDAMIRNVSEFAWKARSRSAPTGGIP